MRRLGVVLAARYPDGALGSVVAFKPLGDLPERVDLFAGPLAHPLVSETIEDATALYHATIGPAYSPDDLTYTLYDIPDDAALYDLVGERMLAVADAIGAILRPEVLG